MASGDSRLKRIEERLELLVSHFNLEDTYRDIRQEREKIDSTKTKQQILQEYRDKGGFIRLRVIELILDILLENFNLFDTFKERQQEEMDRMWEYRKEMADLVDNDTEFKKQAKIHYGNKIRREGYPVLYNKKWVWIDSPEKRLI